MELTNDTKLTLNPMALNDLYEDVWNVGSSCNTPPLQVILSVEDSTHPVADKDASTPGAKQTAESRIEVLVCLLLPIIFNLLFCHFTSLLAPS